MPKDPRGVSHRPLVIYTVTIAWILTALATSLLIVIGIATLVTAHSSGVGVCVGTVLILVGSGATAFHLYVGWSFYTLKPFAYQLTRKSWSGPQFILATGFWKWLDREDVRELFE